MTANESAIDRHVRFDSVFNFRDLGGYPAAHRRAVRWRTLFRADGLHRLAGDDLVRFAELGVHTVLDLRTHIELEERGRLDAGGQVDIRWHHLSVQDVLWDPDSYTDELGPARFLADRYLEMIADGPERFGRALKIIADPASKPLVFHCAAGKDRTGTLAALTLSLVGVSDDDVAADYALSNLAVDRWTEWLAKTSPETLEQLRSVPRAFSTSPVEAMHLFLEDVRARYGSVPGYAAEAGVTEDEIESLRAHLLEPAPA